VVRLTGTTPAASDDDGSPDPALARALASSADAEVATALLAARVLVPVVAVPNADDEAEMAVPALVDEAGRRALPVFSGTAALAAWRTDGRPVPMAGTRVLQGAVAEGYDAVVVDVAGPAAFTIAGELLTQLAAAAAAAEAHPGARIQVVR
jgi:hypothetical protein